jgi:hypothetical protein
MSDCATGVPFAGAGVGTTAFVEVEDGSVAAAVLGVAAVDAAVLGAVGACCRGSPPGHGAITTVTGDGCVVAGCGAAGATDAITDCAMGVGDAPPAWAGDVTGTDVDAVAGGVVGVGDEPACDECGGDC